LGTRFSPGTFLAVTALDSWYVKIWAECGVVGLYVHIGMLLTFMIYFGLKLWKIPLSVTRQIGGTIQWYVRYFGSLLWQPNPWATAYQCGNIFEYLVFVCFY
jgi:hypothetical protein